MAHRPAYTARYGTLSQRAVVVAVDTHDPRRPLEPELAEFEALAAAAGAHVAERIVQRREAVDPATLVGSGKAREIAERSAEAGADLILVLNNLRPRQRKNLEAIVPLPIVDRTMLILDVFARHARSREGKLQVELAQLRYRQSNLIGVGADLSRLGGGIGTRGPGETKLEVDRRRIGQRIGLLNQRLASVRRQRAVRRAAPRREPLIALVGYTNAGKSSLLNALARSDAFVADQPFATLDPTVRRVFLGSDTQARLADTVGFITELPKDLIAAFRATLEELRDADLLVHVIDAANPDWPRQRLAVESILRDLELDRTPSLLVYNKADLLAAQTPREAGALYVSAARGAGLEQLRAALRARLQAQAIT
jgi:GTPase